MPRREGRDTLINCVVVLGPTASGKTRLGVALADRFGGEIVSADSRQVYRGLDIGTGKDLDEYCVDDRTIPYHLIDIRNVANEYNVFAFQQDFYRVFEDLRERDVLPVVVGGTGLYLEAILQMYRMVEVPDNAAFRAEVADWEFGRLEQRLREAKPDMHNTTDVEDRARLIRAIEIAEYTADHEPEPAPEIHALVLGTRWPRPELHRRIEHRLRERTKAGLIEEIEGLLAGGVAPERLKSLGLEYRYGIDLIEGEIRSPNDFIQKLLPAIKNFAKRQETWFRRMERRGTEIHWIDEAGIDEAIQLVAERVGDGS